MDLLRLPAASEETGISIAVLRAAIKTGRLRAYQFSGPASPYEIDRADLNAWVESNVVAPEQ